MRAYFVSPEAQVGPGTTIGPFVVIGPNVKVGRNCQIQAGAVIGTSGFGYEKIEGEWVRREHSQGVEIADDVHIGANACIDAGSYRPTKIGRGTRIDNLVHIAHNVSIGERCMVIAHAEVSGSVSIEDDAWVAPSASIHQHRRIGQGATVGLGAVVLTDIPDGETWAGVPARRLDG